ncbi:SixA phosphatase family protein [Pararhodospirillum photometricum]|nr:histidine phosphatase family protein [Pararhodospirillum photometricum]
MIMKRLLLLRHAKSDWSQAGQDDIDRALAPRGTAAAERMAAVVGAGPLDAVLCSPARRARETLALVRPALPADLPILEEPGLYVFEPDPLLAHLRALPEAYTSVLVVGHNPALERVALTLAGPNSAPAALALLRHKFPTAALAEIHTAGPWTALAPLRAHLVAFTRPRDLPSS